MSASAPAPSSLVLEAFDQAPAFISVVNGPEHVFEYVNAAYRQLVGHRDLIGLAVRTAFPEVEGQGYFELLDGVLATGEAFRGDELPLQLQRTPDAPMEERFVDFVYQPLFGPDGKARGILGLGTDVTERVLARRALDEARRINDLMLAHAPNLLCALDPEGRFLRMNPASRDLLGYAPEEMVGRSSFDFIEPEDHARSEVVLDRVKQGEQIHAFENRYRHRDGSVVRLLWSGVWNEEERLILAVGRNVTKEREQEERVRESDARLAFALDAADVGAWDIDTTTGSAWRSRRHDEIFGYAKLLPEWTYETFQRHVLPEDRAAVQEAFDRALATGTNWDVECRILRADGEVRWIWVYGRRHETVGTARVSGIVRDVTEQKASEEALRRAVEETGALAAERTAILGQIADGVIVTDAEGHITFVNEVAHRLHGVKRLDVAPDAYADTYHLLKLDGSPYPSHELPLARAVLLDETVVDEEWVIRRPDGSEIIAQGSAAPVRAEDGTRLGAVLTLRDVTQQRRGEEDARQLIREQAAREAAEAQAEELRATSAQLEIRNRELQDFAYVASHDLQEPLRKIQSFAGMLATSSGTQLDEEGRHFVDRMQAAAERMSGLIRDLLAFSRVSTEAAPPQPVDLDARLSGVLGDLEVRLQETGGRVLTDAPLPTVVADPVQMHQLLLNLVGNALKFHREGVPPVVHVRARRLNGTLELVVEDNGIGFDARHAERIFAPFQRLHARHEYEGTGMGLAIVRRIVERHRGRITATGTPGEGARFVITLPQRP